MRRMVLFITFVLLLAACGSQPEPVTLPNDPNLVDPPPTPDGDTPTQDPQQRTIPTLPPPRQSIQQTETEQVAVVSAAGGLDEVAISPGDIYITDITGTLTRITANNADDSHPLWSPDGIRLYFVSNQDGTEYIYRANVTNTNPIQRVSAFPEGNEREPALSASGADMIFTSDRTGTPNLFRMNATDGRSVQQLTTGEGNNYQPAVSPDNTWIAFVSERDGNPDIYIMDTSGQQVTRLTDDPAADTQPAFSPDGSRLAFISERDGSPQVYLMNLPQPRPEYGTPPRSAALDLLAGVIPPLVLDTDNPNPVIIPITGGDNTPKEAPGWYLTSEGIMRLTYTSISTTADGQERRQVYLASDDNSDVQSIGSVQMSFTQPAVRPLPR